VTYQTAVQKGIYGNIGDGASFIKKVPVKKDSLQYCGGILA